MSDQPEEARVVHAKADAIVALAPVCSALRNSAHSAEYELLSTRPPIIPARNVAADTPHALGNRTVMPLLTLGNFRH